MNPSRSEKIRQVIRQSQPDLTIVLENIFDPLNISAVLRSCDAVGVREVFVVYTKDYLSKRGLVLGKKTSAGAFKWTDVYIFEDLDECFSRVRERYGRILATRLGDGERRSHSLFDLDLTQSTALLFGNEDEGVSDRAAALADGNFNIPQVGFAESLNISVACAVTLFEARRQRAAAGFYAEKPRLSPDEQAQLFERWQKMLREKNTAVHQQAISIDKNSAPLLPVFVQRDPAAAKKSSIRPSPLTKFDL